jgi:hypothetical protein
MMESFLNLLWVAIAAGAFCFWRTRWLHERRDRRRQPLQEWTAFACALVLLFFAVSLTDDLHSELMIFDECSTSRRHSLGLMCPHDTPQHRTVANHSTLAARLKSVSFDPLQDFDRLIPAKEISPSSLELSIRPGRAPPSLPL